ncbi:uncharacterized protein LOC111370058 [Olea europaea var. sylvestris]|uniref:uncharacterized protein LOC111370058 n=1 Tax=Olea europaea var. sylvestris TaxID=158386 RepID=UPI000C1D1239|nr:uncharacterized protein LOC111370058 [Olea europaea var. sylvestris]
MRRRSEVKTGFHQIIHMVVFTWWAPCSGATTTTPLNTWMYSEERTRTGMVKYIAGSELPLAQTDNQHFVIFVKECLQPRYAGVSRNTLRSDTIEYFLNAKKTLIADLEKYGGVISLTSDLWEGINKRGYMAATANA